MIKINELMKKAYNISFLSVWILFVINMYILYKFGLVYNSINDPTLILIPCIIFIPIYVLACISEFIKMQLLFQSVLYFTTGLMVMVVIYTIIPIVGFELGNPNVYIVSNYWKNIGEIIKAYYLYFLIIISYKCIKEIDNTLTLWKTNHGRSRR